MRQERDVFIHFCEKYLSFAEETSKSEQVLKNKPLENCTVAQLQSYLINNEINAHPWPKDKKMLLKICYQFSLIQDKLQSQCLTKYHLDGNNIYALACETNKKMIDLCVEILLCSYEKYVFVDAKEKSKLNGYFVDNLDVSLHLDLVINAQYFLPNNIDLYKLENWQSNDSLEDIFGRFGNVSRACSVANISYDQLSYYLDCQSKIDNDDADNDHDASIDVYVTPKFLDIRKKYTLAWKEVTSDINDDNDSPTKYSTFDSAYQIFFRCAHNIDNAGLDLLFSDDKEKKISFYDKLPPIETIYANKKYWLCKLFSS